MIHSKESITNTSMKKRKLNECDIMISENIIDIGSSQEEISNSKSSCLDFSQNTEINIVNKSTDSIKIPPSISNLSEENQSILISRCVRFCLFKASRKKTIKITEISKLYYPKFKNVARYILEKTKKILNNVFGYEFYKISNLNKTSIQRKTNAIDTYIIINARRNNGNHLLEINTNHTSGERSFLMMILSFMWCMGKEKIRFLEETKLWEKLHKLDSNISNVPPSKKNNNLDSYNHPSLGNVSEIYFRLESQLYLTNKRVVNHQGEEINFIGFGHRSIAEIRHKNIIIFISKMITGNPPPEEILEEIED